MNQKGGKNKMALFKKKVDVITPLIAPEPPKVIIQEKAKVIAPILPKNDAETPLESKNTEEVEQIIDEEPKMIEEVLEGENEGIEENEPNYPQIITENQLINIKLDKILDLIENNLDN
jgi:hypothetical protein